MPRYPYIDADGNEHEYVCAYEKRPPFITLDDGTKAFYSFQAQAQSLRVPCPALDETTDDMCDTVHPNQVDEYNRTMTAIGIHQQDAHYDSEGFLHATRTGKRKIASAQRKAAERAGDDDFKPSVEKGLKV